MHWGKKVSVQGCDCSLEKLTRTEAVRKNAHTSSPSRRGIVKASQPEIKDAEDYQMAFMVPPDFICGISKKVMKDPVVVASGISFERASIQAWLDEGNTHCPVTEKHLANLQLVPNLTLKNLISSWMALEDSGRPLEAPASTTFSSSFESFASSPDIPASKDTHHQISTSLLPKLLQDAQFLSLSSRSIDSSPEDSPQHLSSSFSDSMFKGNAACREHDRNAPPPQPTAISKSSNHDSQFESVPEMQNEDRPKLAKMLRGHLQRKHDGAPPLAVYVAFRISTLVALLQSESIEKQRSSVTELRILAKHDDNNRLMIANAGALVPLLKLLQSRDKATQQEATTALLNLTLNQTVRDDAVKAGAIKPLVHVLKEGMDTVAMENAAVALTNLSCNEENIANIGAAGAISPLLELLASGSIRGEKDAATALYRLSSINENKKRMVRAGVTRLLVNFMSDEEGESTPSDGMVDKAVAILRNLVSVEEGRVAFVEEGGIKYLLQVMERGSKRSKSWGVSILYQICSNSTKHRSRVSQTEALPLLMDISESGNSAVNAEINELLQILVNL
eukprot:c12552_g1_i1 orf=187-1875(+)